MQAMEKRSLIRKQIVEDKINKIQEKKFEFDAKIVVKFDKRKNLQEKLAMITKRFEYLEERILIAPEESKYEPISTQPFTKLPK